MSVYRIAVSFALLLTAVGCQQHHGPPAPLLPTEAKSPGAIQYDSEKILNIYSWIDYIAPDTVSNFEKETGIKVRYDTYDNNEFLETKLLTGHTNYDIAVPTENFFDRQLRAGVYRKLDKTALPNLANADPDIMRRMAVHDPGNQYAIPYMWSTTGLGFNVDQVRARLGASPPDSWALLLDPANAAKLQDCGISIVDSALDVFASVLIYLHRDPNRRDPADVAAASEVLQKIRPFIRYIHPAQYIADLANGEVCLSLGWSGDVELARSRAVEASTGVKIAYLVPREGALITVDMMGIPADAPHPHNAQIWMNYLMRPEVIAAISNYIRYPNGYSASMPYILPAMKSDVSIYPDAATRARLFTNTAVPAQYSRLVTREWTRFRTGY
jgi:putrescine transport system substrate-binding protein